LPDLENINEKGWGGHAVVSQLTAVDQKVGDYILEILGRDFPVLKKPLQSWKSHGL
jgi:hypothetical protein